MNTIQELEDELKLVLPSLQSKLETPKDPKGFGTYWLDLQLDEQCLTIAWKPNMGFGIASVQNEPLYGEGPEEIYTTAEQTFERVLSLLKKL